jgi:hypothetical protein
LPSAADIHATAELRAQWQASDAFLAMCVWGGLNCWTSISC